MERRAFVHVALLTLPEGGDARGPGGAITLALCGSWQHPPPCPLAPHHTVVACSGGHMQIRTVFAVEPGREREVRRRIDQALARQYVEGPDGVVTWTLLSTGSSTLDPDERVLAERLTSG